VKGFWRNFVEGLVEDYRLW